MLHAKLWRAIDMFAQQQLNTMAKTTKTQSVTKQKDTKKTHS